MNKIKPVNILFVQTGGSIDKDYPRSIKGYGFEITEPAFADILRKANVRFDYEIVAFLKKDSQEITDEDRQKLLELCLKTPHDNIVITHGTDTMIESALFLSRIKNKKIIFTGSFKPGKFKDTDADFNIGVAVGAIQNIPQGVYLAMNGVVYNCEQVTRNEETGQFTAK